MQYCDAEEPVGDDDYDDYSKELSQYRRSKENRGRGERAPAPRPRRDAVTTKGRPQTVFGPVLQA